jgi:hypothetical protein
MTRYYGPGFTGTVPIVYQLAAAKNPERWGESSVQGAERTVWDDWLDGSLSEDVGLDQYLLIRVPKPHGDDMIERYCDVMDACEALRLALDAGKLQANYRDEDGKEYEIPARFWSGDRATAAVLNGAAWLDKESDTTQEVSRLIRLPASQTLRIWPQLRSASERRGRAPATDWGLIRLLLHKKCEEQGGVPSPEIGVKKWKTQADAERFVMQLLSDRRESAAESTVRSQVATILREYKAKIGEK